MVTPAAKLHWNYFLALERDMETISRYVELSSHNFSSYSIELAHLLFAAASEVDIVAKLLCAHFAPSQPRNNIDDYRAILTAEIPHLCTTKVYIPRYGLEFTPLSSWSGTTNPIWWRSYNKVKHERDAHFRKANLENSLNALGALLILIYQFYVVIVPQDVDFSPKRVTTKMKPASTLVRLESNFYFATVVV